MLKNLKELLSVKPTRDYLVLVSMFQMGMSFVGTLYFLYIKSIGLSDTQALSLNIIFFMTSLVLELPTGIFADKFGRNLSINLGYAIFTLGIGCYAFGNNYFWFAGAEFIAAIGSSFLSGALDTWLKSEFGPSEKEQALLNKAISSKWIVINGVGIPFMLVSPVIAAKFSFSVSYWMASGLIFLTFLFSLGINRQKSKIEHQRSSIELAGIAWKYFWARPELVKLSWFSFIMSVACAPLFMFWQTIFLAKGDIKLTSIGLILVIFRLSMMLGNWIQAQLKINQQNKSKLLRFYLNTIGLTGLFIFLTLLTLNINSWLAVGMYSLFEIIIGMQNPMFDRAALQNLDQQAATSIRSLLAIFNKLGYALGLLLAGPISDSFGQEFTWALTSLTLLAIWILSQFIQPKRS